jgi:holliday junction DNA helicase RuvA
MIATLSGKITAINTNQVVLEASGVGYGVALPLFDASHLEVGQLLRLFIYEHIREELHDLYGFQRLEDKALFEKLLSVNGVGPKVALAIISSVENLSEAIAAGNVEILQSVPGIGKKVAERIIVELKGKLELADIGTSGGAAHEALVQLGYSAQQAHQALAKVPSKLKTDEERIRHALRELGK